MFKILRPIYLILFFLCIGLLGKIYLIERQTNLFFLNKEVSVNFNQEEITDLRIEEAAQSLKLSFHASESGLIRLGVDTSKPYQVYVDGSITKYAKKNNQIEILIPNKMWGRSEVLIQPLDHNSVLIDLWFYFTLLFSAWYFSKYPNRMATYLLLITLGITVALQITRYADVYTTFKSSNELADLYQRSQYVQGQGSEEVIGDEIIYSFSGWNHVMTGDPVGVDFSHPPLGKYLYGLAMVNFNAPRLVSLGWWMLGMVVFYGLARMTFSSQFIVVSSMTILVTESILWEASRAVKLDLPQLVSFMLAYWLYLMAIRLKKPKLFVLVTVVIGVAVSIKIYFPAIIFVLALIINLWRQQRSYLKWLLFSLPLIGLVYMGSYVDMIVSRGLWNFIDFQKWLFNWFTGGKVDSQGFGQILSTILTGRVRAWWQFDEGRVIVFNNWNVLWPIYFFALVIGNLRAILIFERKYFSSFYMIWPLLYIGFLSLGAANPNLIIIILPFMILNLMHLVEVKS